MNRLVWKLLRKHISIGQLCGFFLANLFGLTIVLLSIQFYQDILPIFTEKESFLKKEYIIISKKISTLGGLTGKSNSFNQREIEALKEQTFTRNVALFTPSLFNVSAGIGMQEAGFRLSTEMFFEAVPDEYIDVNMKKWDYEEASQTIPIIIPRTYLNLYNFGFAQSRGMPKLSEGLTSLIQLDITLKGNGLVEQYKGNIVGFSNRLNTILVPQSFIEQANKRFAPDRRVAPSRLILEVANPSDKNIARYIKEKKYEVEGNGLDNGKTSYFLRLSTGIVLGIGVIISLLSVYILMLSIFLLLQKNSQKLANLLLIGYSYKSISIPYCILSGGLNLVVMGLAFISVGLLRSYYIGLMRDIFPTVGATSMTTTLLIGIALFASVTVINVVTIQHNIKRAGKR